jgi:hypothetical protein
MKMLRNPHFVTETGRALKNPTIKEDLSEKSPEEILDKKFERKEAKKTIKKPPQKDIKKLEKIVKGEVQKAEKEIDKIVIEKHEPIEFIIKETSYFKLNWFYLKTVFIHSKKFMLSPYHRYVNWWNKKFNTPKLSKEDLFLKKELLNSLNTTKELPIEFQKDENEILYEKITDINQERYEKPLLNSYFSNEKRANTSTKPPFRDRNGRGKILILEMDKNELQELLKIKRALKEIDLEEDIFRSEK